MNKQTSKNTRFHQSFNYAIEGIVAAYRQERNTRYHTLISGIVVILGLIVQLTLIEWLWIFQAIVLVFAGELLNTAIEEIVDEVSQKEYYLWAKKAKDIAAGAVCLLSTYAGIVGVVIFVPKIFMK